MNRSTPRVVPHDSRPQECSPDERAITSGDDDLQLDEIHLSPTDMPDWFRALPSVDVVSRIASTVAEHIAEDLARQPLTHWRGSRPLSPIEQLDVPLSDLRDTFLHSLAPTSSPQAWGELLKGHRFTCAIRAQRGLFGATVGSATFSAAPSELHPTVAVVRTAQTTNTTATTKNTPTNTTDKDGVLLLAEADAKLAVTVDQMSGPETSTARRTIWGRRYKLARLLTLRFGTDLAAARTLEIPVLAETPWGLQLSVPGRDSDRLFEAFGRVTSTPSVAIVSGHFIGEDLQTDRASIEPELLGRVLRELDTTIDVVALATRAESPSAALTYARVLANTLGLPVVAADGSCDLDSSGRIGAMRTATGEDLPVPAMWYATVPGGSVPKRLSRHSLATAIAQVQSR